MCQKSNAEFSNYTKVKKENLKFITKKKLKWFNSSKNFKRGFCSECGSSLFFQSILSDDYIAISTGSLDKNIPSNNLKKFKASANGFFDKFIYKIK